MNLYNNCEELLVRPFFKIFETGDLRHLMREPQKSLTKSDVEVLTNTWESIIIEYEGLTKDNTYSQSITVSNNRVQKLNRLIGIKVGMMLLSVNEEKGKKALMYWNIKARDSSVEEITRIRNIILAEQTRLAIKTAIEKTDDSKINFYDHWGSLQSALGYQVGYEKICVAEWISLLNVIKSRGKNRQK